MKKEYTPASVEPVDSLILVIRGQRVLLDKDLARSYGVETKVLNQAVKRNPSRFPDDFVFRLTTVEARLTHLRSQFVTLKRGEHLKYAPYAFTEHGAIMAANVLNSPRAVRMSVFVVRAFVQLRAVLTQHKDLALKLAELDHKLTSRIDDHEGVIRRLLEEIRKMVAAPSLRKPIGFEVHESRARYGASRHGKKRPHQRA